MCKNTKKEIFRNLMKYNFNPSAIDAKIERKHFTKEDKKFIKAAAEHLRKE